jgi:cytoskeletal protein CcmA (bactofilin family)
MNGAYGSASLALQFFTAGGRALASRLLLLLCAGLPIVAPAIEWSSPPTFDLPADQTLTNELWLVTGNTKIAGTAERSLFLQAQNLELSGQYRREVWALADTLTFSGEAAQSLRVFARRSAQFAGRVAGTLMAAGETVQLQKSARVAEDAVLLGQDVMVEGAISNNLWALATKLTLAGHIGGSARVVADEITLMPGASIAGDLRYSMERDLVVPEGVFVHGKLVRVPRPNFGFGLPQLSLAQTVAVQFAFFLAALLAGVAFVALFPRFTMQAVAQLRAQPGKCLLTGGIALPLLCMVAVMAALTWVGLPLAALLLGLWAALLYLAKFVVAIVIAVRLLTLRGQPERPLGALPVLVVGLFLLYVGAALPVVGFAVQLVTVLYGFGALALALFYGERGGPVGGRPAVEPPPLGGLNP